MNIVDFYADPEKLAQFLRFPAALYADDPNWAPDHSEAHLLNARNNPYPAANWRHFMIQDEQQVYGRLTAIVNPKLVDDEGQPYGQLGFFECVDNLPYARALVKEALNWLKTNYSDIKSILAPINFDTWHAYRLRTSGFNQSPFPMEPYNPPYYPEMFKKLGFHPTADYVTKTITDLSALMSSWETHYDKVIAAGYKFRSLDPDSIPEELSLVYSLSKDIFQANPYFIELPQEEYQAMYGDIARAIDPQFIQFATAPSNRPAGFSFSFSDPKAPHSAHIKTYGVVPQARNSGLGAALAYQTYQILKNKGYTCINHCLMHLNNRADQFDRGIGKTTREYTLYKIPLKAQVEL